MIARSPGRLIAAANSYIGVTSDGTVKIARQMIDTARLEVGATIDPSWDAALLHRWGFWSHFDHVAERSSWPLPRAANAQELGDFAALHDALHEAPEAGDVFLQYSPCSRSFVRAGVIAHVVRRAALSPGQPYADVVSIEGNTDQHGVLGGGQVLRVLRRLSPAQGDRFLRWWEIGDVRYARRVDDDIEAAEERAA